MGAGHLLSQQSRALIQYCAELGLILKKYLANSQQASYSLFCLFTPPACYVVIQKTPKFTLECVQITESAKLI